ncbi:MAG: hypothetical protein WD716_09930 [Fimbriimonadaceae bacterium]
MRKLSAIALLALAALGCQPGPDGESFTITPEMEEAARVIEKLEEGEQDAALVGTWEGLTATEERLVFAADGEFEALSSETAVGQGYWATKEGALNFVYFEDATEGAALQTCEYEIGPDGHLSIRPDHITRSGSGEFRKVTSNRERVYELKEGETWGPDFYGEAMKKVQYVDVGKKGATTKGKDEDGDPWTKVACEDVVVGFADGTSLHFDSRTLFFDDSSGFLAAILE